MKLAAVMAVAALGVIGCGGDDSTSVGPSSVPGADLAVSTPADGGVVAGRDMATAAGGQTAMVTVGPNGTLTFSPSTVTIHPGDTVMWTWASGPHTVTSGTPGNADGRFCSNGGAQTPAACNSISYAQGAGATYSHTFTMAATYPYYCTVHGAAMTGTVVVQ